MTKGNVVSLKFLALCSITFLTLCNVAVFFNFHLYLQGIGFSGKQAGFLIGLYSLTAMILYASTSQRINLGNARISMLAGIMMVASCGIAYVFTENFWLLAVVRMVNGAGIFLIMAPCMVVLVTIIPHGKSGLAFSFYSVALLSPYSIMPAVSEVVTPLVDSPTILYMVIASLLVPSALFIFYVLPVRNVPSRKVENKEKMFSSQHGARRNLFRKPILSVLLVNSVYFTLFSSLYYLFEGFAVQRGISNPGYFFTIQMGVMVAIRLVGGSIFDTFSKVSLVCISLVTTGAGFILLYTLVDPDWILYIAVVFGIGMGLCTPPLNALMYLVTKPEYRGYNANMMLLTIHLGTFAGPFLGSWIIQTGGYNMFLIIAIMMTLCGSVFFVATNPAKTIEKFSSVKQRVP